MKIIEAKTQKQKLSIEMDVLFFAPIAVRAVGYDAYDKTTKFFDRIIEPNMGNKNRVEFTLPISPNKLEIQFTNISTGNDNEFAVNNIEVDYLNNKGVVMTKEHYDTAMWIQKFCRDASFLPDGIYRMPGGKLWINYMPQITENGQPLDTPARVEHDTGEMQVNSTQFKQLTVPQRIVVCYHEDAHHRWDNTDETFCDMEALRIALGFGFPKTECIYTFTDILSNTHQNKARMKKIVNYINNY